MLRAGDVISGLAGKATANIDGNIEDMFYIKNLNATMTKRKTEVKVLGSAATQHKAAGWAGAGSMTMHYMTSVYRKLAAKYAKTGVDTYFTITVVNEDDSSTIGKQTTVLYNCNIDTIMLAKLDVDSDDLDESVDFTFDGFDFLDEFGMSLAFQ
jgi:hypothetical protein